MQDRGARATQRSWTVYLQTEGKKKNHSKTFNLEKRNSIEQRNKLTHITYDIHKGRVMCVRQLTLLLLMPIFCEKQVMFKV